MNAFIVPAAGGEVRQVTTGTVSKYFPQWTVDGQAIFFSSDGPDGRRQLFRLPASGGLPEQITNSPVYYFRWSPDGARIYFPGNNRGDNDLFELRLADGRERRLTRFSPGRGELGGLALAASATHLYFTLRNDVGDIWVMDVVPDRAR